VPGQHRDVITEREKFSFDSSKQKLRVATGQIPSTDTSGKEDVAPNEQLAGAIQKAKAAGTMTGHLENLHFYPKEVLLRRLLDEEIGLSSLNFKAESELPEKLAIRDHRNGLGVASNRAVKGGFDSGNILNMIDMAVRKNQHLQLDLPVLEPIAHALRSIKEDRTSRRFQLVTIRLKNAASVSVIIHSE
jgi:hypothetical protein